KEIPMEFLQNWIEMQNTGYKLSLSDLNDFKKIFQRLKIKEDDFPKNLINATEVINSFVNNVSTENKQSKLEKNESINKFEKLASIKDFQKFKENLLKKLECLEKIIDKLE
ncbi:MAG: hypothetical protein ACFFHV_23400, partial [Promethearchaeota archaeon]